MSQLDLTATSDFARSGSSQSNIGTAAVLAGKIRLTGAGLLVVPSFDQRQLIEVGTLAGTLRLAIHLFRNDTPTPDEVAVDIYVNGSNSTGNAGADRTAIVSADHYVVYFKVGTGGMAHAIFDKDGNTLASGSNADPTFGGSDVANGVVNVGIGVDSPGTKSSPICFVDGLALYSAALTGDDRWSEPSQGDANILGLWRFDENTGSTAGNDVAGGVDLTLNGAAGWQSGGAWASGGARAHYIYEMSV